MRNFLNPLSRVDIFESANNLEPCVRASPDIFESADVAKLGLALPRDYSTWPPNGISSRLFFLLLFQA